MQEWITEFMNQFGYIGIFLLISLENIFPPIPSEIILTFGGFMTTYTNMSIPVVIGFATAGSVVGAIVLYRVGRFMDAKKLEGIINRWGHILRIKAKDIQKADSWFNRHGYLAVFFCRMVPIVRSLISVPAGMANMKFGVFMIYTIAGTLIWNTVLIIAGAMLGESWGKIVEFMDVYSYVTYVVLGLLAVGFILYLIIKKRRG